MKATHSFSLVFLFLVFLLLNGCTRPVDTQSKVLIDLSKIQNQTKQGNAKLASKELSAFGYDLKTVVINVRGPNIAVPIVYFWDLSDGNGICGSSNCMIEVPMGDSRFFQVLAIYEDSSSDASTIYYGDLTKSISLAYENIPIAVTDVTTGLSAGVGKKVNFQGRLVTDKNFAGDTLWGPTGPLVVRIKPQATKPAMDLMRTEVFAGWFKAIGLTGFQFEYSFNGYLLGGGPILFDSLYGTPSQESVVFNWPAHYIDNPLFQGSTSAKSERLDVFGFFGPYSGMGNVCYDSVSKDIPWACLDSGCTSLLGYLTGDADTGRVFENPRGDVANACTTANAGGPLQSKEMFIDPVGGGLNISGPYQPTMTSGELLDFTFASSTLIVNWSYLPDLERFSQYGGPRVVGSRLFGIVDGNVDPYRRRGHHRSEDSFSCMRLQRDRAVNPANILEIESTTFPSSTVTLDPADFGLNRDSALILCPFSGTGSLFDSGIGHRFNNQAGGDIIALIDSTDDGYTAGYSATRLPVNVCMPIQYDLKDLDSSGNITGSTNVIGTETINIALDGPTGFMFFGPTDSTCSTPLGKQGTLSTTTSSGIFYVKSTAGGEGSIKLWNDHIWSEEQRWSITNNNADSFEVHGEKLHAQGLCYHGRVFLRKTGVEQWRAFNGSTNPLTFTLASGTNPTSFFSDDLCSTSTTSVSVLQGDAWVDFYYTINSTSPNPSHFTITSGDLLTATAPPGGDTVSGSQYTFNFHVGPNSSAGFGYKSWDTNKFNGSTYSHQYVPGQCYRFRIASINSVGATVPLSADTTMTFQLHDQSESNPVPWLYTKSDCSDSTPQSEKTLSFKQGDEQSEDFYFKVPLNYAGPNIHFMEKIDTTTATLMEQIDALKPWLRIMKPTSPTINTCYSLSAFLADNEGNPVKSNVTETFNVSLDGSVGGSFSFHNNNSCSLAPVSQLTVPAGQTTATFYIMFSTPPSSGSGVRIWTENANDFFRDWFGQPY